jgi:hypothetical protein
LFLQFMLWRSAPNLTPLFWLDLVAVVKPFSSIRLLFLIMPFYVKPKFF